MPLIPRYFKEKQASTPKDADDASDAESVGDDEFDQLMANYFKSVKGNVFAGDDEEEDDFDFAADIHKTPTNKGKNKNKEDEDDGDDDEMDISDGEDDGPADDADEMIDLDDLDDDDDGFEEEDGLEVFEEEDGLEVFEDFDVPQTASLTVATYLHLQLVFTVLFTLTISIQTYIKK